MDDSAILDDEGLCALIRGTTQSSISPGREAQAHLLRAFCQARDYRRHSLMLTAYLQILAFFDPEDVPAYVHRSAGTAAMAWRNYQFALLAFHNALDLGYSENLELLLRDIEAAKHKLPTNPAKDVQDSFVLE